MLKKIIAALLAAITITMTGCAKTMSNEILNYGYADFCEPAAGEEIAVIKTNMGDIYVRFFPEVAPKAVENFKTLAEEGYYDGVTFHRVIKDFMIQGGDPEGTGMGGSPDKIKGEFASNGVANPLSHTAGVISMARRGNDKDSASSQFFIMHKTATHLDGDYAAFGKVWRGIETVNQIAEVPTNSSDKPLTDVVIKTMSFVEIPQ